jgi:hypothetical protein
VTHPVGLSRLDECLSLYRGVTTKTFIDKANGNFVEVRMTDWCTQVDALAQDPDLVKRAGLVELADLYDGRARVQYFNLIPGGNETSPVPPAEVAARLAAARTTPSP